jgi:hypothetical protein
MLDQMTAPDDAARGEPARLDRVGFHALVEQLAKARKIEEGCVTVIGLDAIRERLGARWPRRSTQVWEAVDRLLERRLPPHALHARIDDVSYLIEAGTSPESAQATSFKLLQELHLFFLGEPGFEAMRVASVLSFDGGRLLTQPVVGRSFAPPADAPPVRPPPATPDSAANQWSVLSFAAASHRVQVAYERQTVILLSTGKPTAVRLRPVVRVDGAERSGAAIADGLTHAELMALDQATMLEAMSVGDGAIVAPFFFETLSSTRGRAGILKALAGRPPPRGMLAELIGIDRGTPESRVLETVSLVAPYCAAIIVQASADRPCFSVSRATRLKGMSIDCEDALNPQRGPAVRLMECKTRSGIGPLLFACGLASPGLLPLARAAGATHASLARRPAP